MALISRLAASVGLFTTLSFAGTWSGALVNSKCFSSEARNTRATSVYVDRDTNSEIRACTPNSKTTSFAIVDQNGQSYRLDAAGNAKAVALVQTTGKQPILHVAATGQMSGKRLQVTTLSITQ
jgi:hypothetical protein